MEILLWLAPAFAVTVIAMAWVGWVGREGRGHIARDEALRRMGAALEREPTVSHTVPKLAREPSTGVAVRRRAEPAPVEEPGGEPGERGQGEPQPDEQRRAS